jgi:hypothetical protein
MARIFVAGGLFLQEHPELGEARKRFASFIGRHIVARGHVLLGTCRTLLDAEVANAAAAAALELKLDARSVVRSWVTKNTTPSHAVGEVVRSRVADWSRVPRGLAFPEPVQEADVVVIIGGWDGPADDADRNPHYAATWAHLANKPVVPVAAFGLAAAEIFEDEVSNFERRYAQRLTIDEFGILNRLLPNSNSDTLDSFARDVISLAERLITPTEVFVIMSFAEKGHLRDASNTFCRVCGENGFKAFKVDQHFDSRQRIVPNIVSAIRKSAFIIADVSEPKPNVYYELGYAQALGKDIVTTAFEGTQLPFDIFDVPTHFWDCQDTLERKLRLEIGRIGERFGRR